jgi:hypothetical protein
VTDLPVPGLMDMSVQAFIAPGFLLTVSGATAAVINRFSGIVTGPNRFGIGTATGANLGGGDGVGLDGSGQGVFVPKGYVSGVPLSDTSTYLNASFDSIGLFPGTFVYSWGSGDHADSFTIQIGPVGGASPVPEPSSWAMMLLGFAGLGYAAVRRKSAVPSISS